MVFRGKGREFTRIAVQLTGPFKGTDLAFTLGQRLKRSQRSEILAIVGSKIFGVCGWVVENTTIGWQLVEIGCKIGCKISCKIGCKIGRKIGSKKKIWTN